MPRPAPYKTLVPGAVVLASLAVCAVVLWRGDPGRSSSPQPAKIQGKTEGKIEGPPDAWLALGRASEASGPLKALQAKFRETPTPGTSPPGTPEDQTRALTLVAAAKLGEPAAAVWLAEVGAADPRMGAQAIRALGQITNRSAAPELGDIATSQGPAAVRAGAIRALAAAGDLAQAVQLGSLVADESQPSAVRQAAAIALGQMRRPGSAPPLAAALEGLATATSREAVQLRLSIVQALGLIDTTEARVALDAHATRSVPPSERAALDRARHAPAAR